MAFLKVISNGEERTVFLADAPVVLGRGQDADVLIPDAKASRHHCVIEPSGKGWTVRDLDSGNGTRLNGEKIAVRRLAPDDVVKVGDARIVFAGEAAAVVAGTDGDAPAEPGRPRRRTERRPAPSRLPLVVGLGIAGLLACFALWSSLGNGGGAAPPEERAYRAFVDARTDREVVREGSAFLDAHYRSDRAAEVRAAVEAARARIGGGGAAADDFDPGREVDGLPRDEAIAKLEAMLEDVPPRRRGRVRVVLERLRAAERAERDEFFAVVEADFREHLRAGEFARAREVWFFLAGDENWQPIPRRFLEKIVAANRDLEAAAVRARSELLDEAARYEAAFRFKEAIALLRRELPRFSGTSVERSLRDRIRTYEKALEEGVTPGAADRPASLVRVDVEEQMAKLLDRLPERDFAAVADGLEELAAEAKRSNDPGYEEIAARVRECRALAALHASAVASVTARPPKRQIARRYRVLGADARGLTVRAGGEETRHAWTAVPVELYLPLLEREAAGVPNGWLGLVVAAHALEGGKAALPYLAAAYEKAAKRAALDEFVAGRLRREPVPTGGYVVHDGALMTRREYLRKREEMLIAKFKAQLAYSYEAVQADRAFRGLEKMTARKDALDERRKHAMELIYDEKRYFYPYRNTPREGEYWKVQAEVDRRVAAVRELWDYPRGVSVKSSRSLDKHLAAFDEAARELDKRLVDVADEVEHVGFLRAYLGEKFTIRTFFRNADEMRLLRYSREVMESNRAVPGDIRPPEREQVRVTNEYRMMFGHRPLRIVEALTLSSRGHCEEMARIGYFGHYSPTPGRRSPGDRMRLAGYKYGVSENCAAGATAPLGAHNQWCRSSGHHRNLLNALWTEMGSGQHGRLWTQNFGRAPLWSKDDEKRMREAEDGDAPGDGFDSRDE